MSARFAIIYSGIWLALGLLLMSTHAHAQGQTLSAATNKDVFSSFEIEIDKIVDQQGIDGHQILAKLLGLENQINGLNDFVILSAHRCYWTTKFKDVQAYQAVIQNLNSKLAPANLKNTVLAGIELCQMYAEADTQKRAQNLAKAFHFVKNSQAAALRYWISTLYIDLAGKQGRARDAIDAANIAINIARANKDYLRQSSTLRRLAMLEVDFGDKEEALNHIDESIALRKIMEANPKDIELLVNRAFVLFSMKRYEEALVSYREAEVLANEKKNNDYLPIIWSNYADIAYAQGDFPRAKKELKRLFEWAQENNQMLMTSYGKMTAALLAIESKNPEQAQQLFDEAGTFFLKENYQVEMREFYGNLAKAYAKHSYYKQAYAALEKKLELSAKIDLESRGHAANELRELLNTEERIKENLALQSELQKNRFNIQRWLLLVILLVMGLAWSARLFINARRRNSVLQIENKELDLQRFQDPLTSLFNRRYVMENSKLFWQRVQKQSAAIMIIDADHFKNINDHYGHPAGDAALIEMARRIQSNVRENDVVVRWGGEEFLVCSFSCNEMQVHMMVLRILEELQRTPLLFEDKEISMSASIGYILQPLKLGSSEPISFEECIKFADAALYFAKAKGRNRSIGIEKINANTKSYSQLFDHFEEAVARGDIEIKESLGLSEAKVLN